MLANYQSCCFVGAVVRNGDIVGIGNSGIHAVNFGGGGEGTFIDGRRNTHSVEGQGKIHFSIVKQRVVVIIGLREGAPSLQR